MSLTDRIRGIATAFAMRCLDQDTQRHQHAPVRIAGDAFDAVQENGARFDEAQREFAEQQARPVDESLIEVFHPLGEKRRWPR